MRSFKRMPLAVERCPRMDANGGSVLEKRLAAASRTTASELSANAGTPLTPSPKTANTTRVATSHRRGKLARGLISNQPTWVRGLQREGFAYLGSTEAAIQDLVKEAQQVGQIEPEPAIETSRIETPIDERIMPLDHHKPFAFHAMHSSRSDVLS